MTSTCVSGLSPWLGAHQTDGASTVVLHPRERYVISTIVSIPTMKRLGRVRAGFVAIPPLRTWLLLVDASDCACTTSISMAGPPEPEPGLSRPELPGPEELSPSRGPSRMDCPGSTLSLLQLKSESRVQGVARLRAVISL